jgi:hypothetical protein
MKKEFYLKRAVVIRTVAEFLSVKAIETLHYGINDFVVDVQAYACQRRCL